MKHGGRPMTLRECMEAEEPEYLRQIASGEIAERIFDDEPRLRRAEHYAEIAVALACAVGAMVAAWHWGWL